jgi:hypothetical protein
MIAAAGGGQWLRSGTTKAAVAGVRGCVRVSIFYETEF